MAEGYRALAAEIGRFLAAGVGNTLLTIGVYQLLVGSIGPLPAYAISWAVGIGLVMGLYPRLVFRRRSSWGDASAMGVIYLVAFAIGCGVTALCAHWQVPDRAIIVIAAAVTSLFTYVCGRHAGSWLAWIRQMR